MPLQSYSKEPTDIIIAVELTDILQETVPRRRSSPENVSTVDKRDTTKLTAQMSALSESSLANVARVERSDTVLPSVHQSLLQSASSVAKRV